MRLEARPVQKLDRSEWLTPQHLPQLEPAVRPCRFMQIAKVLPTLDDSGIGRARRLLAHRNDDVS